MWCSISFECCYFMEFGAFFMLIFPISQFVFTWLSADFWILQLNQCQYWYPNTSTVFYQGVNTHYLSIQLLYLSIIDELFLYYLYWAPQVAEPPLLPAEFARETHAQPWFFNYELTGLFHHKLKLAPFCLGIFTICHMQVLSKFSRMYTNLTLESSASVFRTLPGSPVSNWEVMAEFAKLPPVRT